MEIKKIFIPCVSNNLHGRVRYFFIVITKGSYQDEPDYFFKILNHAEVCERIVSDSALCKAGKKLKYEAFKDINARSVNYYYEHFPALKWHGFTLPTVDGSTVKVSKTDETAEHFGIWKNGNGDSCPVARVSQMFDVLNRITVDAVISPKETGNGTLPDSISLISCRETFSSLTGDRGYPAFRLFCLILSLKSDFCAGISCTKWKVVRKFFNSGKNEKIINLKAPYTSIKKCKETGLGTKPLTLRLICIGLDSPLSKKTVSGRFRCLNGQFRHSPLSRNHPTTFRRLSDH